MFGHDRSQLRQQFFIAWENHSRQQMLEPVQQQIVAVILEHPEYHKIFAAPEDYLNKDYLPEFGKTNPFLHLSLHLGIREQVSTDRPAGIFSIYQQLLQKMGDTHAVEHAIMDHLVAAMLDVQHLPPEIAEKQYLEQLRRLI